MNTRLLTLLLLALIPTFAEAAPPPSASSTQVETRNDLHEKMNQLQTEMADLMQRMGELSARIGDNARASAFRYLADPNRGMLGLAMQPVDGGARIVAISPHAPADRAGLKFGDLITAFDGKMMLVGDGQELTALDDVSAGKPVQIEILRNGESKRFLVTPERRRPGDWTQVIRSAQLSNADLHRMQLDIQQRTADLRARAARAQKNSNTSYRSPMLTWNLGLSTINPELGTYFGVQQGALVLSAQQSSYPGLKAGDVITSVDGNEVQRAEDVVRALREGGDDSSVRLALHRHGKSMIIDMPIPSLQDILPPAPPAPAPPAPPALPAPPPPPAPSAPSAPRVPPVPATDNVT